MTDAPHAARIEVRLRELSQLFNSMDPSPFNERDLDADAEEFIVSWARELPPRGDIELVVHLATPPPPERAAEVEQAVRHFFAERAAIKRLEFRLLMRRGRLSLAIGLMFLTACMVAGQLVGTSDYGTAGSVVRESLMIGGWVAMWRPLQIFLYDWWPVRDECRILERLARMRVSLVLPKA
ncbi:MAG: hypothetical protein WC661_05225 [Opitutaceae bacterium]|jgi:hypothetical protein